MSAGSTILEHAFNVACFLLVVSLVAMKHGPSRVRPFIDAACFGNEEML